MTTAMDDDRLTHGMRGLVASCVEEAARRGSTVVEAEHVLLAISADPDIPACRLLADAGLDHASIEKALREERLRSLESAGVQPIDAQTLPASRSTAKPRWGASAAMGMKRERRGGGSRELAVLIGILRAEVGTVPRALAIAGVDRAGLLVRLEQASL
ncbi:MAG: Clp protease N-terminal domain-containing protein [Actinomycetota bacterium]